jgi:glycosyltransferase involved in cell wall biosynthesis
MSSRSPTHIGVFLPDLNFGGVERVMFLLAGELTARGVKVDLVVATGGGPAQAQLPEQVRLVDLEAQRTFTAVPGLTRYLRRERPAALVAAKDHANVAAVLAAELARLRTPVLATVHSRPSAALARPERWTGRIVGAALPAVYGRAAAVVAVSDGVADDLRSIDRRGRWRITTIANPVVSEQLLLAGAQPPAHPWYKQPREVPIVVWCGRLSKEKDPVTAVRAFAALLAQRPARLVIVGDGALRAQVERTIRESRISNDVLLTGYVGAPAPYIAHADVLLLSSRREGLPTVLVEALALSTPVVSTDCESGPRQILADGAFGTLVAIADPNAMAAALATTLDSEPLAIPSAALQPFTIEAATNHYLDLLESIGAA